MIKYYDSNDGMKQFVLNVAKLYEWIKLKKTTDLHEIKLSEGKKLPTVSDNSSEISYAQSLELMSKFNESTNIEFKKDILDKLSSNPLFVNKNHSVIENFLKNYFEINQSKPSDKDKAIYGEIILKNSNFNGSKSDKKAKNPTNSLNSQFIAKKFLPDTKKGYQSIKYKDPFIAKLRRPKKPKNKIQKKCTNPDKWIPKYERKNQTNKSKSKVVETQGIAN
ncbi:MAG: hypothetical protein MHPSP_000847, partial [Paramarteilia canceri]